MKKTKLNTGAGKELAIVAKARFPFAEEFEQIGMTPLMSAGHQDSKT